MAEWEPTPEERVLLAKGLAGVEYKYKGPYGEPPVITVYHMDSLPEGKD